VGNVLFVTSKQNANEIRAEVDPNQQGVQSTLPYINDGTGPVQPQLPGPPPAPGTQPAPNAPPPVERKTGDNGDGEKSGKSEPPPKPDRS
jgi:hypothetical protein